VADNVSLLWMSKSKISRFFLLLRREGQQNKTKIFASKGISLSLLSMSALSLLLSFLHHSRLLAHTPPPCLSLWASTAKGQLTRTKRGPTIQGFFPIFHDHVNALSVISILPLPSPLNHPSPPSKDAPHSPAPQTQP
jgi:hypothetical protein